MKIILTAPEVQKILSDYISTQITFIKGTDFSVEYQPTMDGLQCVIDTDPVKIEVPKGPIKRAVAASKTITAKNSVDAFIEQVTEIEQEEATPVEPEEEEQPFALSPEADVVEEVEEEQEPAPQDTKEALAALTKRTEDAVKAETPAPRKTGGLFAGLKKTN